MRKVLEGLSGILHVEIIAERDAFIVRYDCADLGEDAIMRRIRSLGYRPRRVNLEAVYAADPDRVESPGVAAIPLPPSIAAALSKANGNGKLLLLDFYADWCAPCRRLDRDMRRKPVALALEKYSVERIDTDADPGTARHFRIRALPTIIIMDEKGAELFRHVGYIPPGELIEVLDRFAGR